jgi:hypothetical protein
MRRITLTMLVVPAVILAMAASLVACNGAGLLTQNQLDAAKTTVGYTLTIYADGYQPILAEYAKLKCPAGTPCTDALYKKLWTLDAAVAKCSGAATATLATNTPDFVLAGSCVREAEAAKLAFATHGVSPHAALHIWQFRDTAEQKTEAAKLALMLKGPIQ